MTDSSFSNCLHVRQVSIETADSSTPAIIPAVFGIFRRNNNDGSQSQQQLQLLLAMDNEFVLQETIVSKHDVVETSSIDTSTTTDLDPLLVLQNLLQDTPHRTTKFRRIQGIVSLSIVETTSELPRRLFTRNLAPSSKENTFKLLAALVDTYQTQQTTVTTLQQQLVALHQSHDQWRDTANQLTNVWELERSKLLHNFLLLYNQRGETLKQLQQQLKAAQHRAERQPVIRQPSQQQQPEHSNDKTALKQESIRSAAGVTCQDEEPFANDLVERLAAGPTTTRVAALKRARAALKQAPAPAAPAAPAAAAAAAAAAAPPPPRKKAPRVRAAPAARQPEPIQSTPAAASDASSTMQAPPSMAGRKRTRKEEPEESHGNNDNNDNPGVDPVVAKRATKKSSRRGTSGDPVQSQMDADLNDMSFILAHLNPNE